MIEQLTVDVPGLFYFFVFRNSRV